MNPNFNPDTNQLDRPYLRVVEEHQSLAPIVDLQLRDKFVIKNEDSRKSQNELLVVSGSNYTSHINIIRKGISIKDHISIEDLPAIQSQGGLNCAGNQLFIRVFGMPQIIVAKVELNPGQLSITEVETPGSLSDIAEHEEIHLIKELDFGFLIVTDRRVKLLSRSLEVLKDKAFADDMITCCDFKNGLLLISLLEGKVISFRLQDNELLELAQSNLNHEIFGASMTADGEFACVGLQDAPLYSIVILKVDTMKVVE